MRLLSKSRKGVTLIELAFMVIASMIIITIVLAAAALFKYLFMG